MVYDQLSMGDTNNGLAVAQALKPKELLFKQKTIYPHAVGDQLVTSYFTKPDGVGEDRIVDLRTQSPEVILCPSSLGSGFMRSYRNPSDHSGNNYKASFDKSLIVRLTQPDYSFEDGIGHIKNYDDDFNADLNIVYAHQMEYIDKVPPNTIIIDTVPTRVNAAALAQAGEKWRNEPRAEGITDPSYLVIVGERAGVKEEPGAAARDCRIMAETIAKAVKKTGGSVAVTTSPRTAPESSKALRDALAELLPPDTKVFFYDYKASEGKDNPYMGLLARSQRVLLTDDSMSMASDVIAAGKPLFVFPREKTFSEANEIIDKSNSHQKYLHFLKDKGYVQPLSLLAEKGLKVPPPCNSADAIAGAIKDELQRRKEGKTQQAPVHIPIEDYLQDSSILSQKRLELMHAAYTRGDELPSAASADTWQEQQRNRNLQNLIRGDETQR